MRAIFGVQGCDPSNRTSRSCSDKFIPALARLPHALPFLLLIRASLRTEHAVLIGRTTWATFFAEPVHPLSIDSFRRSLENEFECEPSIHTNLHTRFKPRSTIWVMFPLKPDTLDAHRSDSVRFRCRPTDPMKSDRPGPVPGTSRVLRWTAAGVALSTVLTGCFFSSGSPSSIATAKTVGSTLPGAGVGGVGDSSGVAAVGAAGAATVPDTYVPGQPAPTVPLAQAQAVQLEAAANSTTTVVATPGPLAPITSLLATAEKGLLTAEAASRNLWDSWQDKDRERAVLYASPGAVKSLFALPWRPETVDQGCRPSTRPEMAARCLFVQGTVVKILDVSGSTADGYKVARVTTARQNTPAVSVLPTTPLDPSVSVDPNLAGLPTTTLDPNVLVSIPDAGLPGGSVDAGGIPVTVATAQRSGTGTRRSAKTPTTRKTSTKTTKAPRSGASGVSGGTGSQNTPASVEPTPTPATQPANPASGGGVPAGAPVVNQVE